VSLSPRTVLPPATGAADAADRIRVMVVDDSAVVRGLTTRWLETDGRISVVGSAGTGEAALRQLDALHPDVVVLDIEMPVMDGITALPLLLKADPDLKVVMSSTLTARNAEISLKALSLGAADYVTKPSSTREMQADAFRRELIEKVKALGAARRLKPRRAAVASAPVLAKATRPRPEGGLYGRAPVVLRPASRLPPRVVAIGSSTGGPQALFTVVSSLSGRLRQPLLITQHMPATFTAILAEHLSRIAKVDCREGVDGETLVAGRVYLAPGDRHMVVEGAPARPVLRLTREPPENFCRPSVDPMLRSLAAVFGGHVLGVVLTGMGHDGLTGGETVVRAGGTLLAQDEATSVVWGMPGAVATGGLCAAVVPLPQIASSILQLAAGGTP